MFKRDFSEHPKREVKKLFSWKMNSNCTQFGVLRSQVRPCFAQSGCLAKVCKCLCFFVVEFETASDEPIAHGTAEHCTMMFHSGTLTWVSSESLRCGSHHPKCMFDPGNIDKAVHSSQESSIAIRKHIEIILVRFSLKEMMINISISVS